MAQIYFLGETNWATSGTQACTLTPTTNRGWTVYFVWGSANDAQSALLWFCLKTIPLVLLSSSILSPNKSLWRSFTLARDGCLPVLLPKGWPCSWRLSTRKGEVQRWRTRGWKNNEKLNDRRCLFSNTFLGVALSQQTTPLFKLFCATRSQHIHLSIFAFWKTHFLGKLGFFVRLVVPHTACYYP